VYTLHELPDNGHDAELQSACADSFGQYGVELVIGAEE
jgi:hypothetical protein